MDLGKVLAHFPQHYFQHSGSRAGGAPGGLAGGFTGSDRLQSTGSALAPSKGNAQTSGFVCVYNIKTPFLFCITIFILLARFLFAFTFAFVK